MTEVFVLRRKTLALVLALLALDSTMVHAEQSEGGDAAEPVLTPPELVEYAEAEYPAEAFAQGIEAIVVATIDIDEGGLVTGVTINESVGHGFDEAAEAAMRRFVFVPATRDGEPISSQVLFRYTFFIKDQAPPTEGTAPPLRARIGGVVTSLDGKPISGAAVALLSGLMVTTDAKGRFVFEDLPAGSYQVDVVVAGFKPLSNVEKLEAGENLEVVYRLEMESALYETVVRGRKPPREVTRREVTRREITRIPGTGGDALRAIQNLPGMARAPAISGELIVRGSSPGDTQVFFDSIPMPLLYHFGGLTSVVNSDLLESIDFYPGNYSVRYGGATGGIIDVYPRSPKTDRLHAYLDVDIWDVGALAEGPITDNWSVAVAARRSYIDGILNAAMPDDGGFEFTTAPRYWDYQIIADYHPSSRDNLRLFAYGSDDQLVFVFGKEVLDNPNFTGGLDLRLGFHMLQARWDHTFSKVVSNQVNAGFGYQQGEGYFGRNIEFELDEVPLYLRDELVIDPGKDLIFRTGIDAAVGWARYHFRAPEVFPREGAEWDPLGANTQYVEDKDEVFFYDPGWYGELELITIPKLRMIYGLRVDYIARIQEVAIDPRFMARYKLFEGTTLKTGIGLFHQSPEGAQANDAYGNPDLKQISAIHYGFGVEQQLFEHVEMGIEGFYKDISNLVVPSDEFVERDGIIVPRRYSNDGRGNVYGMEVLVKHQPTDRFFGWITYTLMRSKRIDFPGEEPRLFDHDQTHILTIIASLVLGRGWEVGLRFRLVTGNPVTPVTGAVYEADSDIYFPTYDEPNSKRLPLFHQLDIRIDKNLVFNNLIKAAIYLDVQNVYNHKNVESYAYSYDYTERQDFYGLPILPSLGIKLEY
ncbi:MAG: TonB family protein [Deltaproteobacteria bacterium]|nr:TonB family protein [Deltaproteobacteria bacterium]